MVTNSDRNAAVALYRSINPHWHPDQKRYEPAIDKIEAEFAAVRKERDAEWKNVAREAIPLIKGRLEIAKKENDPYLVKWATETIEALNALIKEVK